MLFIGAGWGLSGVFVSSFLSRLLFLSFPHLETARYRLKNYLKWPLNAKQSTGQLLPAQIFSNCEVKDVGWLVVLGLTVL